MNDELARRVFFEAFEDEMIKISASRGMTDLEKQAFIGKAMKAVGKAFGKRKPAVGTRVGKKTRPLVDFSGQGKPLRGRKALRNQKHISGIGGYTSR